MSAAMWTLRLWLIKKLAGKRGLYIAVGDAGGFAGEGNRLFAVRAK